MLRKIPRTIKAARREAILSGSNLKKIGEGVRMRHSNGALGRICID
jgi:hypothetical protein